jgi:hypothetical protein
MITIKIIYILYYQVIRNEQSSKLNNKNNPKVMKIHKVKKLHKNLKIHNIYNKIQNKIKYSKNL